LTRAGLAAWADLQRNVLASASRHAAKMRVRRSSPDGLRAYPGRFLPPCPWHPQLGPKGGCKPTPANNSRVIILFQKTFFVFGGRVHCHYFRFELLISMRLDYRAF
jgi:hypothetical protein